MTADAAGLKELWMQAFGDTEETVDAFFRTAFSPERYAALWDGSTPVCALYWLDCSCSGYPFAYLYAVATGEAYRGQGYASRLLEQVHRHLRDTGYAGVVLVPGEPHLFSFYQKRGYQTFCTVCEFTCSQALPAVSLTELDKARYGQRRGQYLPAGSILQTGETLDYLETYASFYQGSDFIMAASLQGCRLVVHELLGNPHAAPGVLAALGASEGTFHTPGPGRNYAMYLPLRENCPVPVWFGLALD